MNHHNSSRVIRCMSLCVLAFFAFTLSGDALAQVSNDRITHAIQSSKAQELSKYFNNSIDLTIPGSEGTYSKVQAEQIINSFFSKFPLSSYTMNHKGVSNDGSMYAIGTYKSGNKTFRTYYLTKSIDGSLLIHQLKIESRDE